MVPELEEDELEQNVQPMVLEYFEHGDTGEVVVRQGRGGPWGGGSEGQSPCGGEGVHSWREPSGRSGTSCGGGGGHRRDGGAVGPCRGAGRGGAGCGHPLAVRCRAQELLRGLNLGGRRHAVPSLAVVLALEGKASHRELTSRLLSDLVGRVLSPDDVAWAFDEMLRDLPDLILDAPEAPQVPAGPRGWGTGRRRGAGGGPGILVLTPRPPQMLGQFIARAVADHALPLDFLERYKGRVGCEHAR